MKRLSVLPLLIGWVIAVGLSGSASCDRGDTRSASAEGTAASEQPAAKPAPNASTVDAARDFQMAPDFELADLGGGTLKLSELRGKVVLLDFWATWCGPCRKGIPHLNSLVAEHGDSGLEIVGISVDRGNSNTSGADLVRAFTQKTEMNYRLVMADAKTVQLYGGIRSIPTAFLVDREGRIRKRYVGLQPPQVFERDVKELLDEGAAEDSDSI
ncbi:MAG: TlpA family protein disulfide reductase [Gemmatimonadetes bacterium]|nr:TlpA family protein disulfide reductase [Gemmatimonadota bacterium]